MASPAEKLAQSLEELKKLQNDNGFAVVRSSDLTRTHLDRLVSNGYLIQVIKGWYLSERPEKSEGDTTSWYTSFWYFISEYLNSRFQNKWCLSPKQSLQIHSGNWVVPKQLLVRSPLGKNNKTDLLHGISIFDIQLEIPPDDQMDIINGVRVYSLSSTLINIGQDTFNKNPIDSRTCLYSVKDSSDLLSILLEGGNSVIAGRVAGAFRNIGNNKIADEIISTMKSAGYDVRESDPYNEKISTAFTIKPVSPYASRIKLIWDKMRDDVIKNFPDPTNNNNIDDCLKNADEKYVSDAYHSLSIEGYMVTTELIEKVRSGDWNPEDNDNDMSTKNALAARGYWQCFKKVKESIKEVFGGEKPGKVADKKHGEWYRELFGPSVSAGIIKASDLAGYRNSQVYIAGSMHTPPNKEAVRDAMPILFDLLSHEDNAAVRAILGHFVFVYIHPYMDGNGRIARFLMNLMLTTSGYPWLIIPVEKRDEYMKALESASVKQDITPFTKFLASLVNDNNP